MNVQKIHEDTAKLLYRVGTGMSFNVGAHIYKIVINFAKKYKSNMKYHFPSLIHNFLARQKKMDFKDKMTMHTDLVGVSVKFFLKEQELFI